MKYEFQHLGYNFTVSAGYPPVCSEEEKDHDFDKRMKFSESLPENIRKHYLNSWVLSRLSWFTNGSIGQLSAGHFLGDGSEFAFRFRVDNPKGEFVGKFGLVFYPNSIQFAGYSNDQTDLASLFMKVLLSNVDDIHECELVVVDEEDNREYRYGWNGYNHV